jgi:glycerol-3-phosphate acyltransferase PlsY
MFLSKCFVTFRRFKGSKCLGLCCGADFCVQEWAVDVAVTVLEVVLLVSFLIVQPRKIRA